MTYIDKTISSTQLGAVTAPSEGTTSKLELSSLLKEFVELCKVLDTFLAGTLSPEDFAQKLENISAQIYQHENSELGKLAIARKYWAICVHAENEDGMDIHSSASEGDVFKNPALHPYNQFFSWLEVLRNIAINPLPYSPDRNQLTSREFIVSSLGWGEAFRLYEIYNSLDLAPIITSVSTGLQTGIPEVVAFPMNDIDQRAQQKRNFVADLLSVTDKNFEAEFSRIYQAIGNQSLDNPALRPFCNALKEWKSEGVHGLRYIAACFWFARAEDLEKLLRRPL